MDIIIDLEFERLLRPLTDQEFLQLECSVLDDGLLSPLVVWSPQNILLDGHHRLRICRKHNIPFSTMLLGFDSREQALQWVRTNQEGRRNLTPEEIAYVLGQQYEGQKAKISNPGGRNQYADLASGQGSSPELHHPVRRREARETVSGLQVTMSGMAAKCGTEQCPLNSVLDGLREQVELQMKVNEIAWDNAKRLADMVTMRGCPADVCPQRGVRKVVRISDS